MRDCVTLMLFYFVSIDLVIFAIDFNCKLVPFYGNILVINLRLGAAFVNSVVIVFWHFGFRLVTFLVFNACLIAFKGVKAKPN